MDVMIIKSLPRIVSAITALFCCLAATGCFPGASTEYMALDYTAVMTNPDLYNGQRARLEAVVIDIVSAPDTDNTYFVVSEPDHDDHVWLVCGSLPSSDVSRLKPGVSVILRGVCAGTIELELSSFSDPYPAIFFSDCMIGVQTGHSSDFMFKRKLAHTEADVWSRDLPDVPHQYTLSTGHYELRRDIPAGNCTIRWVSGYGNVCGDVYDGTIFSLMGDPAAHANVETELADVRLSVGVFTVVGDLVVMIDYQNVNFEAKSAPLVSEKYLELYPGTYSAEELTAFQEYDVVAVSGLGIVSCGDAALNGICERMSPDPGPGEISRFRGLMMFENDELTISGDLVIRLYPYQY